MAQMNLFMKQIDVANVYSKCSNVYRDRKQTYGYQRGKGMGEE